MAGDDLSDPLSTKCTTHCLWAEKEETATFRYLNIYQISYDQHITQATFIAVTCYIESVKTIYSCYFIHYLCGKAVCAQECDMFASVSGSTALYSLVSGRMFYSSPGSRWLTVHDLQHWMINGKKAHFNHRPAYLSAAHWYSCWKCGEKHSWMYGCGLHWKGFDIELCSTAILLRSLLLLVTGGGSSLKTYQLIE